MIYSEELFSVLSDMAAAFWGAFFAFIFGLFSLLLGKRWGRFNLHRNAVVKLEYLLNEYIDRISINKKLLQSSREFVQQGALTYNRFLSLKVDETLDLELENLPLINRYFRFKLGVTRINEDLQSLNYALTKFEELLIHGQPLHSENRVRIADSMGESIQLLSGFEEETKSILCFARMHLRKIERRGLLTFPLLRGWRVHIADCEFAKELEKLDREIEGNIAKS